MDFPKATFDHLRLTMKQLLLTIPDRELLDRHPTDPVLWIDGQRLPRLIQFRQTDRTLVWDHEGAPSGTLHLQASLPGLTPLVLHTSILMMRSEPYRLATELVRGQANKFRNLRVEWERDGWRPSADLEVYAREANSQLCHCLHGAGESSSDERAIATLIETIRMGEAMALHYGRWATADRFAQRTNTDWGLQFPADVHQQNQILAQSDSLDSVTLPLRWSEIEKVPGEYDWSSLEREIDACTSAGLSVQLGPILDFRRDLLPAHMVEWDGDPQTLVTLLIDCVETVVHQFADRVSNWIVTHRTNSTNSLPLADPQWEWLTARLLAAGQQIQPAGRFALGVDQPWGWYAGQAGKHVWPVEFIDSILRLGVKPAGIYVDFHPGSHPLEPPRTAVDVIKVLTRFRRLETPLWVHLAGPFGPTSNEESITRGVLAKPFVEQVTWDDGSALGILATLDLERREAGKLAVARPPNG
jgi:hypothetical protein